MELSDSTFTVIVANDDDDGLLARDLAQQWHADGLLRDFAWVTPQDVAVPTYGPATVTATLMNDEQTELMTLLGARPRTLIRIVVLHLLTHANSNADRLVGACDEIAGLVGRAMPVRLRAGNGSRGMRLLRINLMVPESDLLPQEISIIQPGWEVNAVVSPEDRPDLDRLSVFVRQSVNLHGHGLAAAAAAGGLWSDATTGAFDNQQIDSTVAGRELVVIRCGARMVVGDDRSPELAGKVAHTVQSSESGAAHTVTWGIPADNPRAVIEKSLDRLLEGPEWAPQEREVRPLEKAQVSLGTLLRNWAVFQLLLPLAAVRFMLGHARTVVEQSVTAATVGRGAGEIGRVRPLTPDQVAQVAEFRMRALSDELSPERLSEEASNWGQQTPTAWRELRELAIGLVDGSRLPDRFSRTSRAGLDELLSPSAVVPAPTATTPAAVAGNVEELDVERAAAMAQKLKAEQAAQGPAPDTDPQKPIAKVDKAKDAEKAAQPKPEPKPKEPDKLEQLESWVERRRHTLMWQLAARVYEFRRRENNQVKTAQQTLESAAIPSTRRLETAQKVVIGSWLITLIGVLLLALWVWAASREDPWEFMAQLPNLNWENIAKLVGGVAAILLVAGTIYFQALRAYEWQVLQRMHTIRQAGDEFVASSQQEKRWSLMYAGVLAWGKLLGELLHRPWAEPDEALDDDLGKYDGLPAAVAVAVPVDLEAGPDPRVVTRAVEAVCQRGWLLEEFNRLLTHSPRNDPSAQAQTGDLAADLDLGLRPNGPRGELVEVSSHAGTKRAARLHLLEEVTDMVTQGEIRMPAQEVVRVGPYSAGDHVVDRDFFTASNDFEAPLSPDLFEADALVARHNIPERVVFCLPTGAPAPTLENAEVHDGGLSVATRVDVSKQLQAHSIRLFTRSEINTAYVLPKVDDFN